MMNVAMFCEEEVSVDFRYAIRCSNCRDGEEIRTAVTRSVPVRMTEIIPIYRPHTIVSTTIGSRPRI